MVDFNNDATIATPAADVVRILILQRRDYYIEATEAYEKLAIMNATADISVVKARVRALYRELYAALKRTMSQEDFRILNTRIQSTEFKDIDAAYEQMAEWLDKTNLIRIDTKRQYDTTIVTEEDAEKGL